MAKLRISFPAKRPDDATWVHVEGGQLPHPVQIRLGLSEDGRVVATAVLIEADGELAARDLRLPLAAIVAEVAQSAGLPIRKMIRFGQATVALEVPRGRRVVRRARPGRRGHPDEHYREVARAYRRAKREHPRAPVRALMDELHASEPTVHRWLRTATERGFLEPTERGRAGEAS